MSDLPHDRPRSLLDRLKLLPARGPLLYADGVRMAAGIVIDLALEMRRQRPDLAGSPVVLHNTTLLDTVVQMVAWDGFCSHLILFPPELKTEQLPPPTDIRDDQAIASGATVWTLLTSGTTGTPKPVEHTLESLTGALNSDITKGMAYRWGLTYHPCRFAGLQVVLQSLWAGSELVLVPIDHFSTLVKGLIEAEINALSATPSFWRKLLMDGRIRQCSLQQITLGGEIADQKLLNRLRQLFPDARIVHIYASTEAGVGFRVADGLAGFPLDYLTSGMGGTLLRIDTEGSLWLRPQNLPKSTSAQIDKDGFLNSHDRVEVRGERVHFLGRDSGVINVGGNKVYPEIVEEVLRERSEVTEVRVTAKNSALIGQIVVAEVVPVNFDNDRMLRSTLLEHCRSRLQPYQVPALIRIVEEIGTSSTGKLGRMKSPV